MEELRIRLLGPPSFEVGNLSIDFERRKGIAVLAYLAVNHKEAGRDTLAALLWSEMDRAKSLAGLRRALASINKTPVGDYIEADRRVIQFHNTTSIWVDVREFESIVEGEHPESGESSATLDRLSRALDLYRGPFLESFTLRNSQEFDEWQLFHGERLRALLVEALHRAVDLATRHQVLDRALFFGLRWQKLDPFDENVHRRLMQLYAQAGNRGEAIQQFRRCRDLLANELSVEPQQDTQQLYEAIKTGAFPDRRAASNLRDTDQRPRQNLPSIPTLFVGRQKELQIIESQLGDPSCRLLTLTGPGGIGKTRLALEVAHKNQDSFPDGVFFVPLSELSSGQQLAPAVADSLSLSFQSKGEAEVQLIHYLRNRELLLILDNFEHVISKAKQLSELLRRAPGVKVLVTSREGLNLRGEWLIEIEGLQFPDESHEEAEGFDAIRLFAETTRRIRQNYHLNRQDLPGIIRICRLVAGMPLAIELAAAWMRLLSPDEIAEEIESGLDFLAADLHDLPERHRSLRAVFSYSLHLLSEQERSLFARLSVFRSGFDRRAAKDIAEASLSQLLVLVNKSLIVRSASGRFSMHPLVHQLAREELDNEPEEKSGLLSRFCAYYCRFMEEQQDYLKGPEQNRVLSELRSESENLRLAWDLALQLGQTDLTACSLETLSRFLMISSRFQEGDELMGRAAGQLTPENRLLRARLMARQGRFCISLGDFQRARILLEESLAALGEEDVPEETGYVLTHLSSVFYYLGEYEKTRDLLRTSVSLSRVTGDRYNVANSFVQLGRVTGVLGDHSKARQILNRALVIFEEMGDRSGMARSLINLGNVELLAQSHLEAQRLFLEALEHFEALGDRRGASICLSNLGLVFEHLGEHEQAQEFSLRALKQLKELGDLDAACRALENLGTASFELGRSEEAESYFQEALKTSIEIRSIPVSLIILTGMVRLMTERGSFETALETALFISDHPKVDSETRERVLSLVKYLEGKMAVEEVGRLRHRAGELELSELAARLLDDPEIDFLLA